MGRQKVWSHSLCKQISKVMFGCIKSPWWCTHSLFPKYSLCNINLICTVAILQLNWCMYSRFRWANVLNAFNLFFPPQFKHDFFFIPSIYKSLEEFFKKRPVREGKCPRCPLWLWFTFGASYVITPQQPKGQHKNHHPTKTKGAIFGHNETQK